MAAVAALTLAGAAVMCCCCYVMSVDFEERQSALASVPKSVFASSREAKQLHASSVMQPAAGDELLLLLLRHDCELPSHGTRRQSPDG